MYMGKFIYPDTIISLNKSFLCKTIIHCCYRSELNLISDKNMSLFIGPLTDATRNLLDGCQLRVGRISQSINPYYILEGKVL